MSAIDRSVQKTGMVSLIVPDGGQVLTVHDENSGLGPQVSDALTIGEAVAELDLTDFAAIEALVESELEHLLKPSASFAVRWGHQWVRVAADRHEPTDMELDRWARNWKPWDSDEVVAFQPEQYDAKFRWSAGDGFGDTGDKAHVNPDKKRRAVKRYDRRKQHQYEDKLIAMIDAEEELPVPEPLRVTIIPHDAPEHVMPCFQPSLDPPDRYLTFFLDPTSDGFKNSKDRNWNQAMREVLGLGPHNGLKPQERMTELEYDWWENRLAAEIRKDHEAEKERDKKAYDSMLNEARALAVGNPDFIAWEREWKAYYASCGRRNRPRVSPPPGPECEWYSQLCELRDLFTRPGKSIIKQNRKSRIAGEKLRDVGVHTVEFEKQWEMKFTGIRAEIKEGKYNQSKLAVDAIIYATSLKDLTSTEASEQLGKTGAAMRKMKQRRLEKLRDPRRPDVELKAGHPSGLLAQVLSDRDQFLKAAPEGVERGWYILAQLPQCPPRLYKMDAPADSSRQAIQAASYTTLLRVGSELTAWKIEKYGRKKISYGQIVKLAEDTMTKVRQAFFVGRVITPEDCDSYNLSPSLSQSTARLERQEEPAVVEE